ncbi:DMT family transporter [Mangrovicella endophytica]|uniref:DMT family transporter n=1 Tax=Mangrovicella endophytica TaxID=2066697 RepID=UPI000C9E0D97|nr:DMT family transporter [Mangrovicella endophytica]
MAEAAASRSDTMTGIGLSAAGYALFALQDVIIKLLVVDYAVAEILFARSIVVVLLALAFARGKGARQLVESRNKRALLVRAVLILLAWLSFYSAAREMELGQLTTLYFAAPVIVVVMAAMVLKETVGPLRWAVVLAGFIGVLIAVDPSGAMKLVPTISALFAACCWALSVILVRLISRTETTTNQMIVSNGFFALACGLMLPFLWRTPDGVGLALMLVLGVIGGVGQLLLYEGFRFAPASVVAPVEYTGLVWAFSYGYLIWSEVPATHVVLGAAIIVISSLCLIWHERRAAPPRAVEDARSD